MTPDAFPILNRFPAAHPDRLQLYTLGTPNGVKVSILLEELGLPYDAHRVPFGEDGTGSDEFRSLSLNNKIPAILDPDGPGGKPLGLFESGAILLYLADKHGRFIGADAANRQEVIQWLFWQMGGMGPMFGQVGFFFKYAGADYEDKRPRDRYIAEAQRLLGVLDRRLEGREWVAGDYSIADMAMLGWVRGLDVHYEARDIIGLDRFAHVATWLERGLARPAVQRGLAVPAED
jgi:GST-like protein